MKKQNFYKLGIAEQTKIKQEIAKKIWDTPFATANLEVLKKDQLVILIQQMLFAIGEDKGWHEEDLKDGMFDEKCYLIELLDPDFFERN